MPGKNSVDDLRNNGIVKADQAWKERLAAFQFLQQIRPEFFFQSSIEAKLMSEAAGAEFAKRPRQLGILHGKCGRFQPQV